MKPTRIIKKYIGTGRNNNPVHMLDCDNEKTYTAEDLAIEWEVPLTTLYRWLREKKLDQIQPKRRPKRAKPKKKKPVVKAEPTNSHEDQINAFIPQAVQYANRSAHIGSLSWDRCYFRKMNELTIKAGLRCGGIL